VNKITFFQGHSGRFFIYYKPAMFGVYKDYFFIIISTHISLSALLFDCLFEGIKSKKYHSYKFEYSNWFGVQVDFLFKFGETILSGTIPFYLYYIF
jgi:hypothetical protein